MTAASTWIVGVLALVACAALAIGARTAYRSEMKFHVSRAAPERPHDIPGLVDVEFTAADGVRLVGWFVPTRTGATIVLAHGLGQGRRGLLPEARFLLGAGYGVLLFDMRGHGASGGSSPMMGDEEQLDIEAAIAWMRKRPDVDPHRIGAIGFSIGANALAHVAARNPEVRAIVLLSPSTRLVEDLKLAWGRRGPTALLGGLLPFYIRGIDLDAVRPVDVLASVAPRHVLMVAGAEEPGQWMLDDLARELPPGSTNWVIPGAGHGNFIEVVPAEYERRLLDYLGTELMGGAAPLPATLRLDHFESPRGLGPGETLRRCHEVPPDAAGGCPPLR